MGFRGGDGGCVHEIACGRFGMNSKNTPVAVIIIALSLAGCETGSGLPADPSPQGGGAGGSTDGGADVDLTPVCESGTSQGPVQAPVHVMALKGQTSWFASPVICDLDGDGANELVAAYYDVYVFSSGGSLLYRADDGDGRVYAPHVVADLDGDGITEVVAGRGRHVWAWEWISGALTAKHGWPADTTTAGESPEVRGLAAADLNHDGQIEVVATTTQTQRSANGGAQVFVFSPNGSLYQPVGGHNRASDGLGCPTARRGRTRRSTLTGSKRDPSS